jgi:hypothetical protein
MTAFEAIGDEFEEAADFADFAMEPRVRLGGWGCKRDS